MQRITAVAGGLFLGMALPLYAQLYVIVGSPTPNRHDGFSASLMHIDGNGAVDKAASLIQGGTPRRPAGLFWMSIYHDARKAVLMPTREQGDGFISFDFAGGAVTKECDFPPLPHNAGHCVDCRSLREIIEQITTNTRCRVRTHWKRSRPLDDPSLTDYGSYYGMRIR